MGTSRSIKPILALVLASRSTCGNMQATFDEFFILFFHFSVILNRRNLNLNRFIMVKLQIVIKCCLLFTGMRSSK